MICLVLLLGCKEQLPEPMDSGAQVQDSAYRDTGSVDDTGEEPVPCTPEAALEGDVLSDTVTGSLAECQAAQHAITGPQDAEIELHLAQYSAEGRADWRLLTVGGEVLEQGAMMWGATTVVTLPWAGEFLVELRPQQDLPADYQLDAECIRHCDGAWTRYPIVLMHGLAGTESFVGLVDYFYGVRPELERQGYQVLLKDVDPYQDTAVRALQWQEHLDALYAEGHHRRVNLVAHSQGGLDARYLASLMDPDARIVSITTISTPHNGTSVADIATGVIDSSMLAEIVIDSAIDALMLLYGSTNDQDIAAQMYQMSSAGIAEFNLEVLDRDDVMYQSWAGRTCAALDFVCQYENGGEIVTPVFAPTHLVMALMEGDSDGLVGMESARWGSYRGEIPADHIDEIGQIAGATAPGFEHLDFYSGIAADLQLQGF